MTKIYEECQLKFKEITKNILGNWKYLLYIQAENQQNSEKVSKNDSKIFFFINLIGNEFKNFRSRVVFDALNLLKT